MSDDKKITNEEFSREIERKAAVQALKEETATKKAVLDAKIISARLEEMRRNEQDLKLAKNSNFGELSEESIKKLQDSNDDYIKAARSGLVFINSEFDGVVPFFRKNFILIGGKTGEGKSTTVANIVHTTIAQINPATGKNRRALVITNEECAEDFYNRVTALIHGWSYTNHSKFTQEQIETYRKFIPKLAKNGTLTVVDNTFNGSHGVTTTIEGIESIFDKLIEDKEYYDVVIIDYYQNIISSKVNPNLSENEVQARLSRMMDKYKNSYPAPIVMMVQVNPKDKEDKTPFQYRIKGRKIIMDPATLAMEMVADREYMRTMWVIHKSRFTDAVGKEFYTGYDFGKYVPYTSEFAEKAQKIAYERTAKNITDKIDSKK